MAQAVVQNSCKKLRSAIRDDASIRLFTRDLQEMLKQLIDIDEMIAKCEVRWNVTYNWDHGQKLLPWVEAAAYRVCHVVEELQEMTVPTAGEKMAKMVADPENGVDEPKSQEDEMLVKMKEIKQVLKKLQEELREELQEELVPFAYPAERRPLLQAPEATAGREEDVEKILVAKLSAVHSREGPIMLAIHGEWGAGKATVAGMVFDNDRFKCYSRIWINNTETLYSFQAVGKYIISHLVSAEEEEMSSHGSNDDLDYITNRLHELLNGKKVLLVLHNLRGYNDNLWKSLKDMLTVQGMGSTKVIVIATLQISEEDAVAMGTFGVQTYCLRPLNEEMCCKIIKQAAAKSIDEEDLKPIAARIAKFCKGIPLVAQLFGSMLEFKQHAELLEIVDDDDRLIVELLLLGCRCMPPNLRLCAAYCAFVLDTQRDIVKEDLIHQWIALDLIEPSQELSAPQVAEKYLSRLLDMSLLQTAKSSRTSAKDDTNTVSFIIHRMVRNLINIFVCDSLGEVFQRRGQHSSESSSYVMLHYYQSGPWKTHYADMTRALCCLRCRKMKHGDGFLLFPRHLRVLELHESPMQKLPESICQLRHLGYLKLSSWSGLVTLPDSIGDLINLVHIDLSDCYKLKDLTGSFGKLINLLYISLSGCSALENLPDSFGNLIKVVNINLSGCSGLENLPESFTKLIKLVHINLSGCLPLVNLPASFGKLTKLEHANLSDCTKLANLPGSFGKLTNLVHINLSGCCGLRKLPGSFGELTSLVHIDLSGCYGVEQLPQSFGELTSLAHVDLSGCYGLKELPQTFGKLISLAHINLSGCSGLATLPGSFGDLQNLMHVDLSRCYELSKLPESFGKLQKLVHLDLSFWSSFEVIQTALDGLTNLQHLNLSNPCCHAEYPRLEGLKQVLGQLIRLQHLNLSMLLNPIFCNQSEEENLECLKFIEGFSRLRYLNLSHSIFLCDLPENLKRLKSLHTVDLSGCIRLKKVPEWMTQMPSLKSVILSDMESYQFVVGTDSVINDYDQLLDVRCKELEITCLNNMKSAEEARRIRLAEKHNLQKLKLCWSVGSQRTVEDNVLLGELVPAYSLQYLELHGYGSTCFPSWLTPSRISCGLRGLKIKNCNNLVFSPKIVGALSSLQMLCFSDCNWMTLPPGHLGSLSSLRELQIESCKNFERLPYSLKQHTSLQSLHFSYCESMKELPEWLGTLASLRELQIESCSKFKHLPYSLKQHTSLQSLHFSCCDSMKELPEWLGTLTSLQQIAIEGCENIGYLPKSIGNVNCLEKLTIKNCTSIGSLPPSIGELTNLKDLDILGCPSLERWCLGEEGNKILIHIQPKFGENPRPRYYSDSD